MKKLKHLMIGILICIMLTGCGSSSSTDDIQNISVDENAENAKKIDNHLISDYNIFELTSDNLKNGKWDDIISNTDKGQNHSPQLSWEPVEGASEYMIYMVDTSMQYWIHWKSCGITETTLAEGWAEKVEYVGPYPPTGGTHTYEIYVIALKKPIERMKGSLNGQNMKFESFIAAADTDIDGNTGNIAGAAHISGTFTN